MLVIDRLELTEDTESIKKQAYQLRAMFSHLRRMMYKARSEDSRASLMELARKMKPVRIMTIQKKPACKDPQIPSNAQSLTNKKVGWKKEVKEEAVKKNSTQASKQPDVKEEVPPTSAKRLLKRSCKTELKVEENKMVSKSPRTPKVKARVEIPSTSAKRPLKLSCEAELKVEENKMGTHYSGEG